MELIIIVDRRLTMRNLYIQDEDLESIEAVEMAIKALKALEADYARKSGQSGEGKGFDEYKAIKKLVPRLKKDTPFSVRKMVVVGAINEANQEKKLEVVKNSKVYFEYNNYNYLKIVRSSIEGLKEAKEQFEDPSKWLVDSNEDEGKEVGE